MKEVVPGKIWTFDQLQVYIIHVHIYVYIVVCIVVSQSLSIVNSCLCHTQTVALLCVISHVAIELS
jgi:hypothetical protein